MSVRITDNTPKIRLDNDQRIGLFLRQMLDEVHRVSNPKTPKKLGDLRSNVKKIVRGHRGSIEWGQVYAIPQEVGIIRGTRVRHYTTPGTGPHFAEKGIRSAISKTTAIAKKVRLI